MADRKRNNASWCCDKIEELILEMKKEIEELNKEADSLGGDYCNGCQSSGPGTRPG